MLEDVDIRDCRIGVEGMRFICHGLKANRSIQTLQLSYNDVGSDGAAVIAECLKVNRTLKHLDLTKTKLGHSGGRFICQVLQSNDTMQSINLGLNELGPDSCTVIAEMLKCNFSLRLVHLFNNDLDVKGKRMITKALQENGSMLHCPDVGDQAAEICRRNVRMHERVEEVVATLLGIRRLRRSRLSVCPLEIVVMIATHLLRTKIDVDTWKI